VKVRVWEYDVAAEFRAEFETAYGPTGSWAELFARSIAFLGTELFASTSVPGRYLTVDRFADETAWTDFLSDNSAAYAALDEATQRLTLDERELA
jgi:hypothetical protein